MELLFVDDHVAVVNKPSGLLVHRGWGNDDDVAMFRLRDALGAHVYPVHRLDRATSGALVFARTRDAAAILSQSFESRQVDKRYLALVRGAPAESGVIDHPIPKSEGGARVPAVTPSSWSPARASTAARWSWPLLRAGDSIRSDGTCAIWDTRSSATSTTAPASSTAAIAPCTIFAGWRSMRRPSRSIIRSHGRAWRSPRPCPTTSGWRSSGWPSRARLRAPPRRRRRSLATSPGRRTATLRPPS